MIKEVIMYTVICDSCGVDAFKGDEYVAWTDGSSAEDMASNEDWLREKDKHYCPKCYSYDDNDELVIKLAEETFKIKDNE